MKLAVLLLAQSLTIGIGEHRTDDVWRTWAPRWDVLEIEAQAPLPANLKLVGIMSFQRGVRGLNADRAWSDGPALSFGLQTNLTNFGPTRVDIGAKVFKLPKESARPVYSFYTYTPLSERFQLHLAPGWDQTFAITARIDFRVLH